MYRKVTDSFMTSKWVPMNLPEAVIGSEQLEMSHVMWTK